ncbi:MAG: hypothetical protein QW273_01480 [Candidatus Pacearchaeota archaeon]
MKKIATIFFIAVLALMHVTKSEDFKFTQKEFSINENNITEDIIPNERRDNNYIIFILLIIALSILGVVYYMFIRKKQKR